MANTFKTVGWMAKETLRHFENANVFSKFVYRKYAREYQNAGLKTGDTISIAKPARFTTTAGRVALFPDITEESMSMTLQQYNASFAPTSLEMTVSVAKEEFSTRYLKPMAIALASQIDSSLAQLAVTTVSNAAGTPGTTPNALSTFLTAQAIAYEHGMPADAEQSVAISPAAQASMVDALKGLTNPTTEISKQYTDGTIGRAIGARWSMSQLVATRTVGPQGGTPLVNGAGQTGTTLLTKGWTAAAAARLNAGDIFTIAGVFAVNPVTKTTTGRLQQFVVTANASSDGAGLATLSISPAITTTGTTQSVSAGPADNAAITVLGTAGAAATSNVLFHQDAFALAVVPMQTYGGLDKCVVEYDPDSGLAVRFTQGMDVTNDKLLVRADILFSVGATRPEWAARIEG